MFIEHGYILEDDGFGGATICITVEDGDSSKEFHFHITTSSLVTTEERGKLLVWQIRVASVERCKGNHPTEPPMVSFDTDTENAILDHPDFKKLVEEE